jgi:hypothetical protein
MRRVGPEREVTMMKDMKKWWPLAAAATIGLTALAGSTKFVCGLTGQRSEECCCEQKDGKLGCKNTGKTLDTCCCTKK